MTHEFRYPNITGTTPQEQIAQIKSYLHQLVEQLQWSMNNIDTAQSQMSAALFPRGRLKTDLDPDNLECGIYVIHNDNPLKREDTVIMHNGVMIQVNADTSGSVKLQFALPAETSHSPAYRLYWYSRWGDWQNIKH